jgi:hypothetical protein
MGMLLAAASCVPAILLLVYIWMKILEINYNRTLGDRSEEEENYKVPFAVKLLLKGVPVFGVAVFAILIIGERNFFSTQVRWQTEPFSSVGTSSPFTLVQVADRVFAFHRPMGTHCWNRTCCPWVTVCASIWGSSGSEEAAEWDYRYTPLRLR